MSTRRPAGARPGAPLSPGLKPKGTAAGVRQARPVKCSDCHHVYPTLASECGGCRCACHVGVARLLSLGKSGRRRAA